MDQIADLIAIGVRWCADHRFLIAVLTCLGALLMGVIVIGLQRYALYRERWASYFAWGFLVLFIMYCTKAGGAYGKDETGTIENGSIGWEWWLTGLGSAATNILFLAAGRALLLRKPAFPLWALLSAVLASFFLLTGDRFGLRCHQMPDALFSAFCVGFLGYALYVGSQSSRARLVGFVPLTAGGLYGVILILTAFLPYVATGTWAGLSESVRQELGQADSSAISRGLETFAMAVAFLLKLLLFVGAFAILVSLLSLLIPRHATKRMQRSADERLEYMSNEGIIAAMAEVVQADAAELFLLRPLRSTNEMHYWRWTAIKDGDSNSLSEIRHVPNAEEGIAGSVLSEGNRVRYVRYSPNASEGRSLSTLGARQVSVIGIPLAYSGGRIGCVILWWRTAKAISEMVYWRAGEMTAWLTPIFQTQRQIDAMYEFSNSIHIRPVRADEETSIHWVVGAVQRHLCPLASGLQVSFGFRDLSAACNGQEDEQITVTNRSGSSDLDAALHRLGKASGGRNVEIRDVELELGGPPGMEEGVSMGRLRFAIERNADAADRPTLAAEPLLKRAVAAEVTGELLDSFRQRLWVFLQALHTDLDEANGIGTLDSWLKAMNTCASNAGLAWVVAKTGVSDYQGSPEAIIIVRQLSEDAVVQHVGRQTKVTHYRAQSTDSHGQNVIELELQPPGYHLWLGVARAEFGPELDFASPWLVFLERLADVAGAALTRIFAAMELQQLQLEAAQAHSLATIAVTTGTLAHQIGNLAYQLSSGTQTLSTAFKLGDLIEKTEDSGSVSYARLVDSLKGAGTRLKSLTEGILSVTALDEHRPCRLLDAAKQATDFFKTAMAQKNITLNVYIRPEFEVDVPFHVAALALANLVGNAVQAMTYDGLVVIEAHQEDDTILCEVSDNGPGIPSEIRERLFELGVTTKKGSGGWGLFLTRRSLMENGGTIRLKDIPKAQMATTFELCFPKEKPLCHYWGTFGVQNMGPD